MLIRNDDDWVALHELYMEGRSLDDLAGMTHYHRSSISRNFRRRGLWVHRRGRRAA